MKNKSARHKDDNTFKFQPFVERISNIDIDIFHKVAHEYESQTDEESCYFYQAMENWSILNLTESFDNFKKEVRPRSLITLPQLILEKDNVVRVLLKHLKLRNPLSLQALLDIVVALAKDFRKDFYQYYPEFLEVLIELLNTKDTDQLEWVFTCLAYLFKFLWRPLLKDITIVFKTLLPLLSNDKPEYINNFAAGTFAFVTRKVKDLPTFLLHILNIVKANDDAIEGSGKLFFEVIHGVNDQFHSCAEAILSFLFESLSSPKYPQNVLFAITEHVIANIVGNIAPKNSDLLWTTLIKEVSKLENEWKSNENQKTSEDLETILKLVGMAIEGRNGKLLYQPNSVVEQVIKILSIRNLPDSVYLISTQIVILLLLSRNIKLTQEQASSLTRTVLSLPSENILLYFVENISSFSSFEALIWPAFLKHCLSANLEAKCCSVLTQTLLKKSELCGGGVNYSNWTQYSTDFGSRENNLKVEDFFSNNLSIADLDTYISSLICLPHLCLSDSKKIVLELNKNVIELLSKITKNENNDKLKESMFMLNVTIECIAHLSGSDALLQNFGVIIDALLPFSRNSHFLVALKTIDLLITVLSSESTIINMETLNKLNSVLSENFSSPFHEVRLFTTHLYTFFESLPYFDLKHSSDPDTPKEKFQIFSIMFRTESIDPQVQTYREQTQNLDKLNFDKPQMLMCKQTEFKTIPIRYLCGVLYINFKLLWEPTLKIIETQAHGLEIADFWEVYGRELKEAVTNIRQESQNSIDVIASNFIYIGDLYQNVQKLSKKPDYYNYRMLLWKAMGAFADVAEAKTRDVSELLLDFIENEYTRNNSDVALKWNIKQNNLEEDTEIENDENTSLEELNPSKLDESISKSKIRRGKSTLQALTNFLTVFSKVRSPKSMYREPELNKLYFDFLQHNTAEVQKLALDCIMTYKHKYLIPYKTNLYNLVDDKTFKSELTNFRIDKESAIQVDHRENLIPIVMKIVFSKMNSKTGLRTGGKSSGQLRRNLVLRYLAGCEESEMLIFIQMALRFYNNYLNEDPEVMIANITIKLDEFIPPKRLLSTINLLNVILDQFGGLMGNSLLNYILQIVLIVGAAIKGAFTQITNVHAGYLSILRTLRTSAIKIIERFFQQFERYSWTHKQINAIFKVFVWPYLDKLNVEGIHSPTTLLKLFIQWGSNPRYFSLLVKHEDSNEKTYVLPHIIQLLLNEKSHHKVVTVIEEMLEKLLSLQADEEDLQNVIPVDNLLPVEQPILDRIKVDETLNYGTCILLPYVPMILEKIKRKLSNKQKGINQKELFILTRISELVWESNISEETLKLLLPIVLKRCAAGIGEEVVNQLLTTILNLLNKVTEPSLHMKQIAPLFGEVSYASSRKLLLKIVKLLTGEKFNNGYELILGLNAFDTKWVDQPDFQKRHDTFKLIQSLIEESKIDLEIGIFLIYNCYFLLKSEKDLSLKENSSYCLKQLCPHLVNKYRKDQDYLINETIFALIRQGMKSRSNDFRNECILLLGYLARECPETHVVLRDLNKYTNKADMEVDFFENITHLQIHRHARAMLKFCQQTKELTSAPHIRTLTQFMLPMASFYLCFEKYASKNSVIDAAIECIGTMCRILPWHQYEGLLKYYLTKLRKSTDYQKQLVRITVAILDAFHYDLTKAQLSAQVILINQSLVEKDEVEEELQIDEALDLLSTVQAEDEEEESLVVKIGEKVTVLCKSTATRVTKSIQETLLPQLHRALAEMTQHDVSHKVNRKKTGFEREEEDLLRVPISLALVKLLQRLPREILEANLPGIFMKMCTFLKSHLDSVRRVTRETLQKIMQTLGPNYLHLLLGEMTPLMSRGFHVHVLVFTTHAVLSCLKDTYKPTDLDKVLLTVLKLCQADLFGDLSDEREVAKIAVKTPEAKSTKSYDTLQILAQYITDKCLMDLIMPLKRVIETTHSFKAAHKAQESLRYIALGLVDNTFITSQSLLVFAYGTASESIPELIASQNKPELSEKERQQLKRKPNDCFIIPKAPVGRGGVRRNLVKSSAKTNAHLLVEFGLRLCYTLLKRERVRGEEYKPFLDPFVEVFKNCLNSKHVKLSTLTLQCLSWIMKYELPALTTHVSDMTQDIFALLHKFASAGLSKGDNFDLVVAAFKAIAVLVRDAKYHTINTDQLKILLLYAEQDMHDHDRQATAFNLLKAIIARKLIVPEIHEVMVKVSELSITSEMNYVREQSRSVFQQYLMNYPLGDKLKTHLAFFLSQMSYEMQYGRESAIEMINTFIGTFPMRVVVEHSGTFFISLGARLVNDDVPECRKMIAESISSLLNRLSKPDRDPLFEIIVSWLQDTNISHRRLAAQLCGLLVSVEKDVFETRIPEILPLILKQFGLDQNETNSSDQIKDHYLFQILQMLLKLCAHIPSFLKMPEIEDLAKHIQSLLGYPHDWVRLSACQFIGFVLSTTNIEELSEIVAKKQSRNNGFLFKDSVNSVKTLTLDLCDQLQADTIKSDLAEQVIKNLVFIARVLQKVPIKGDESNKINLLWLTKRMRKVVNTEIVETPTKIVLRTEVFKWVAAVTTILELESLEPILNHLLAPLVREMITTEESNAPLRQLAKEVGNRIKGRVGMDVYTKTLSNLQQSLSVKRAERKRTRTQIAVTDPELFAKKKIKRHEKKKDAKKRKIMDIKGTKKNFKKRKVVDMDPEAEVM